MNTAERMYHPSITDAVRAELNTHPELVQQLLANRGVHTTTDADIFLNPNFDTQLHDPFLLTDMRTAVERILRAMAEQIGRASCRERV